VSPSVGKLLSDRHRLMARVLGEALFDGSPEAWGTFSTLSVMKMTPDERGMLCYAALLSLSPDDAALICRDTLAAITPEPPDRSGMRSARQWAQSASLDQIKCVAVACIEEMEPANRAELLTFLTEQTPIDKRKLKVEDMLFYWPSVVKRAVAGWQKGFAMGISHRSKKAGWVPTEKERTLMHKLVLEYLRGEKDEPEADLLEG